jgi:hypothetical protein
MWRQTRAEKDEETKEYDADSVYQLFLFVDHYRHIFEIERRKWQKCSSLKSENKV